MIYLDNCATTKPCRESLDAIEKALTAEWGNPSSKHAVGLGAHHIIEDARKAVCASVGIRRSTEGGVIFTSGGTEANNLAVFGSVYAKERAVKNGSRGKVFISNGEHSSIDKCADRLEEDGFTVLRIPTVGGELDLDFLKKEADSTTVLLALMLVNNETGAIYDVKKAAEIVKKASPKAFVHCDAIQAYMKMPLGFKSLGVDSMSISAHKIYSPKGAGALIITPDVIKGKRLVAHICGGGQEDGFRSGTENVPCISAFGAAASLGTAELNERINAVTVLREKILSSLPEGVRANLAPKSVPNIINLTLPNIKSETMLNFLSMEGICISSGSACSTHSPGVSHALTSFGLPREEADCSVRISLSHLNTAEEIDTFLEKLENGVKTLQRIKK